MTSQFENKNIWKIQCLDLQNFLILVTVLYMLCTWKQKNWIFMVFVISFSFLSVPVWILIEIWFLVWGPDLVDEHSYLYLVKPSLVSKYSTSPQKYTIDGYLFYLIWKKKSFQTFQLSHIILKNIIREWTLMITLSLQSVFQEETPWVEYLWALYVHLKMYFCLINLCVLYNRILSIQKYIILHFCSATSDVRQYFQDTFFRNIIILSLFIPNRIVKNWNYLFCYPGPAPVIGCLKGLSLVLEILVKE